MRVKPGHISAALKARHSTAQGGAQRNPGASGHVQNEP
jgi:hypothetical protein